ncbi:DUF6107 family protein [Notoacmeibacter sp. MSK16QG-6]|uniref:DUF6107 family protein n=1 Tax=Notoacmeibacter sp. MSK16QG-6 TaxID=2957982 RepID=UPI00209DAAC8|nr:DUF6107 family protein [Notoacmeibacter sp. MSK16QG-6]MCP1198137.1 DUF6107 family protein [Notoacmeibacter sp. MSK16QG-6]
MGESESMWMAKGAGAVIGSGISLAYVLPRGRREAALRFAVGVTSGIAFGGVAGLRLARELGIDTVANGLEIALSGAALASLCAWWAIGVLMRTFGAAQDQMDRANGPRRDREARR